MTFILSGIGFIGGLAVLQWGKVYWYSRLWNAALVAAPRTIEDIYSKKPKSDIFKQSPILELYVGATELFCKTCSRFEAIGIYFSKHMIIELSFCSLLSVILGAVTWGKEVIIFNMIVKLEFIWGIAIVLFIGLIVWVISNKCCSKAQIEQWLSSRDIKRLAGFDDD